MSNKVKFPALWQVKEELEKQKAKIEEQTRPLRSRRDDLVAKIQPMEDEVRKLDAEIKAIERPALGVIANQIAGIAKAMGGKSMSDSAR